MHLKFPVGFTRPGSACNILHNSHISYLDTLCQRISFICDLNRIIVYNNRLYRAELFKLSILPMTAIAFEFLVSLTDTLLTMYLKIHSSKVVTFFI